MRWIKSIQKERRCKIKVCAKCASICDIDNHVLYSHLNVNVIIDLKIDLLWVYLVNSKVVWSESMFSPIGGCCEKVLWSLFSFAGVVGVFVSCLKFGGKLVKRLVCSLL